MIRGLLAGLRDLLPGRMVVHQPPALPSGLAVYAIGDIHGELSALRNLLSEIVADAGRHPPATRRIIVCLGDYVDRGPDSRGVIELLAAGPPSGFELRCLRGNHDQAMLDFLREPEAAEDWFRFGAAATLDSYGIGTAGGTGPGRLTGLRDALAAGLPPGHRAFLENLEPSMVLGDYAFVHAGIRPGRPFAQQDLHDLMWIREPFLSWPGRHEKVIVHGHSVVAVPQVLPNRVALDTGAYATGVLTAAALDGDRLRILQAGR